MLENFENYLRRHFTQVCLLKAIPVLRIGMKVHEGLPVVAHDDSGATIIRTLLTWNIALVF